MAGDDVVIKLQADIRDLTGKITQINSQFSSLEKSVRHASARVDSGFKSISRAASLAATAFAGIGFASATRSAIEMADAMTNMRSRIRLVTDSNEEAAKVQQQLLDVANRTRTEFASVGELYSRLGRSADDLGLSQQRLVGFVETFSQALKVSGASAAEAQSTILQLSQALSSGRLQGAELNAVLESGGRAAKALADGLGVPIGELKKLGEQGLLTSDVVIKAIESQSQVISTEFSSMKVTASDAFTVMQNAIAEMVGKVNESTGATDQLSEAVLSLADRIKDPEFIQGLKSVAASMVDIASVALEAASAVGQLYTNLKTLGGVLPESPLNFGSKLSFLSSGGKLPQEMPSGKFGGIFNGWPETGESTSQARTSPTAAPRLSLGSRSNGSASEAARQATQQYADAVADLKFQLDQLGLSEKEAAFQEALRNNLSRAGVSLESARGQEIADLTQKIQEATIATQEAADLDRFAAEVRREFGDGSEYAAEQQERLNKALESGKINAETYNAAMAAIDDQSGTSQASEEMARLGEQIKGDVAGALFDMASGAKSADEAVKDLLASMAELILKTAILNLVEGATNAIFGGGGPLGAIVGGRALGGGVNPGNSYMVGESGPELFVPRIPGSIIPRSKMGGGNVVIQSTVHAAPGTNRQELQAMLNERDRVWAKRFPALIVDKQRRNALSGAF